jgi:fumarate reductase subunit C
MSLETLPSPLRGEGQGEGRATKEYPWRMPANWWTRRRHYVLYMLREFTAVPMALWLLWLLWEIQRAGSGQAHYYAPSSILFVAFSVVVLLFALYHSYTFLKLAGVIIRIKLFDKPIPPGVIVAAMFGLWGLASVVVGFVLIWFAR